MKKKTLPSNSKAYMELIFREKEKWHRRQERMSFKHKLEVLERLRKDAPLWKSARFLD